MFLYFDTEIYSAVPLERGLDQYRRSAELLIATYALNDEPVQLWDRSVNPGIPRKLEAALLNRDVRLTAHNAQFDRAMVEYSLGIYTPVERWHCTMAQAYAHSLPGALEALGPALGLPLERQKLATGKRLIDLFCKPQRNGKRATRETHPADWELFLEYAIQDADTLREVHRKMPAHNYQGEHLELWYLDQEINERGFQADLGLAKGAIVVCEATKSRLDDEVEAMTDGAITAATQRQRVLRHLIGEDGLYIFDLKRDTIDKMLECDDLEPHVRRLLEIRAEASMTSQSKYNRLLESVGPDGRLRFTTQYAGANRTGRWAGRIFQPHNLPRPTMKWEEIESTVIPAIRHGTLDVLYSNVNEACSNALRSLIVAAPGHELLVGDWSNIEGRVLAWMAGELWKLRAYEAYDAETGPDMYVLQYANSFGISVDDVSKDQRQIGKGQELSCGYGGGVGAGVNIAATYGLDIPKLGTVVPNLVSADIYNRAERNWKTAIAKGLDFELEAAEYIALDCLKQVWRRANPAIVQLWWDVEKAVKNAIKNPGSAFSAGRCKMWCTGAWLVIELPSGRRLMYAQPKVKVVVEVDETDDELEIKTREQISYLSARGKQWRRERTYSGKIVENIDQAISNDILRAGLMRAAKIGLHPVLHVHDEIVTEEPKGTRCLNELVKAMTDPLPWSAGLPLKVSGYAADRYRKE